MNFKIIILVFLQFLNLGCNPQDLSKIHWNEGTLTIEDEILLEKGIPLKGKWKFVFQDQNKSDFELLEVPGSWSKSNKKHPAMGSGEYQLEIILPETKENLKIKFGFISSAYKVLINDELILTKGNPSVISQEYRMEMSDTYTRSILPQSKLKINVFVSNYALQRAGILETPVLMLEKTAIKDESIEFGMEAFLGGGILFVSLLFFVIYLYSLEQKQTLFFSLMCLDIGMRLLVSGYDFIGKITDFEYDEIELYFEYLTYFVLPFFVFNYLQYSYPRYTFPKVEKYFNYLSAIYVFILILGDIQIASFLLKYFHLVYIYMVFIFFFINYKQFQNNDTEKWYFLTPIIFAGITVFNDILNQLEVISTFHLEKFSTFSLVMLHAMILGKKTIETNKEMKNLGENLQSLIQERTEKLNREKQKYGKAIDEIRDLNLFLNQINKASDKEKILGYLLNLLKNQIGTNFLWMIKLDQNTNIFSTQSFQTVESKSGYNIDSIYKLNYELNSSKTVLEIIYKRLRPFYFKNCTRLKQYGYSLEIFKFIKVESLVFIPVESDNFLKYVFVMCLKDPDLKFDKNLLNNIKNLCETIVFPLGNIQLVDQIHNSQLQMETERDSIRKKTFFFDSMATFILEMETSTHKKELFKDLYFFFSMHFKIENLVLFKYEEKSNELSYHNGFLSSYYSNNNTKVFFDGYRRELNHELNFLKLILKRNKPLFLRNIKKLKNQLPDYYSIFPVKNIIIFPIVNEGVRLGLGIINFKKIPSSLKKIEMIHMMNLLRFYFVNISKDDHWNLDYSI
jgi:hypothetical protein